MSAKLAKAYSEGRVEVRNKCSSTVSVNVRGGLVNKVCLLSSESVCVLTEKLTVEELKRSNLKDLIARRFIEIV